MEKVFFSHGVLRASHLKFAIVPGGHIRLKDGRLSNGSLVVEGQLGKQKPKVTIYRVEGDCLVPVGRDYCPIKKSAVLDVVKEKLLEMPEKLAIFAAEVAWRAIMARRALD